MSKKSQVLVSLIILFFIVGPITMVKAESTSTPDNINNLLILRRSNGYGDVIVKSGTQELLNCGDTCDANIKVGTELILSANARSGSIFKGWSINSDNTSRDPQNTSVILSLTSSQDQQIVYAKFILEKLPDVAPVKTEDLNIPRIMFWPGKVSQHWDLDKSVWASDPDLFSGSREDKISYCQKFYPTTEKVITYKEELVNTWKDAGGSGNYISKKMSYRCVLKGENVVGEDASKIVEKPNKGSVCYYFPNNPLCLPLTDPKAVRNPLEVKLENFVSDGLDKNTTKIGAGERTAILKSYEQAFKKLPTTEAELADVIKIGNGQWPSQISKEAEKSANTEFQKIYKRVPNINNNKDTAAITVMAYGLRQKAENRNLASETAALKTFKSIYGRTPVSTNDWNILQAITYSGATREADSDGDLLSDRREKELGTNPNNPDSDGDSYFDGVEVANGYDPLKSGELLK